MTTESFDPALYTSAPRMTVESGITLCRALVAACPQSLPARIHKAAKKLAEATDKAQSALAARQTALGSASEEDTRLVDQAGDASWSVLRARLAAYATLPADEYPDAPIAAKLVTLLFADDGLSFLKESYPVQWATADTVLKRIDADSLHTDINRIAGSEFLDNVRKRHAKYGAMVQGMLVKTLEANVDLSAELRTLHRAIVTYATKVCAHVEDDDAKSIADARTALHPIDAYRETHGYKPTHPTTPPTAETPAET
jgi:hypothetical protein